MGKYLSKIINADKYGTKYLYFRKKRIATIYYNRYLEIIACPDGWALHHILKFMSSNDINGDIDIDRMIMEDLLYDNWNHCYTDEMANPLDMR